MAQDARKFQYNSDYPQPLVVYKNQFTLVPTSTDPKLFKFEHHLPYIPLLTAKASYDQNFSYFSDLSAGANMGSHDNIQMLADDTYIYVVLYASQDLKTNYVRVIGFAPPDYDGDITPVDNEAIFRFNSDNEYAGCIQGVLNVGDLMEVSHNLGYAPQCRSWSWVNVYAPGTTIDVYGYSAVSYSGIYNATNTTATTYTNISTAEKFIIGMTTGEETRVTSKPVYYQIYTLEA